MTKQELINVYNLAVDKGEHESRMLTETEMAGHYLSFYYKTNPAEQLQKDVGDIIIPGTADYDYWAKTKELISKAC